MKPQTERLGIAELDKYFSAKGWLFREQPTHDYGIDAHVEIAGAEYPTGKLIAIQVKSGKSYFDEPVDDGYVFRTDEKHVDYWLNHSMPIIVVIYNPASNIALWEVISKETIVSTGKNWKIVIPKQNQIGDQYHTLERLEALTQPEPYIRRLNRLRVDKKWIELAASGETVVVSFLDWVNKSLPRYEVKISCDEMSEKWPLSYVIGGNVQEMLRHFFPWAEFSTDEEAHRDSAEADWQAECYGGYDKETGTTYYTEDFDEWYSPPEGIEPISFDGEVNHYSLIASINQIGEAFLKIDEHLETDEPLEGRMFSLSD